MTRQNDMMHLNYLNSIFSSMSKRIRANSTTMNVWKIMVTYSHFVKDKDTWTITPTHSFLKLLEIFLYRCTVALHLGINHIRFIWIIKKDFSQKIGFARFNLKCFSCYSMLALCSVWKIIHTCIGKRTGMYVCTCLDYWVTLSRLSYYIKSDSPKWILTTVYTIYW